MNPEPRSARTTKNLGNDNTPQNVSYVCSYVPEEIIMAAGLFPRRMIPEPRPSQADAYVHPNTCHYVKSLLASGLANEASQMKGIIFANSCDGMRRAHDVWKEYVKSVPALFLEIPKKKDANSIEFFAAELKRFAERLENEFQGAKVTEERLHNAITACNNVRLLMHEIFRLQREANSNVQSLPVFDLCLEGTKSDATRFAERLRKFLSDSGEQKASDNKQRIVLTGNVIHRPELPALVENSGGRVVALDTCVGMRQYDTLVKENSLDPMRALAERYLVKASCARMEGIEERFQHLKSLVNDSGGDGIIYSTVKFCDFYAYEAAVMRNTFEDTGIPFLVLENDYEWSGLEQMRTRVEAFLAIAAGKG